MANPLFRLALMAGAGYFFYNRYRKYSGSTTNASDAVDDIELGPDATHDETLDAGVKGTFPASDPVSITAPGETAYEKKKRGTPS
ncbi:MAG TPA: hypothetical protein VKD72_17770 [Gemmataceae bacterium]|nr:hypothetical protein [Gemmataceae bacterium]